MTSSYPARLAYKEFIPKTGADESLNPIIYLHGLTSCKEHWDDIPQIVSDTTKRKAYAIDARNHGDTEWSEHFNFDLNVDDLVHFMDSHNIRKAILVGHSMGGITSMKLALTKPEFVEKIIVEDMTVRTPTKEVMSAVLVYASFAQKAIKLVPPEEDEDGAKKFIFHYVLNHLPPQLKEIRNDNNEEYSHRFPLRRDANGRFHFKANLEVIFKKLSDPENITTECEGTYEGPALFIYGMMSPFQVGADEIYVKKFFPTAVFKGIEGAAHAVHIDKPLEFTDEIIKFIS